MLIRVQVDRNFRRERTNLEKYLSRVTRRRETFLIFSACVGYVLSIHPCQRGSGNDFFLLRDRTLRLIHIASRKWFSTARYRGKEGKGGGRGEEGGRKASIVASMAHRFCLSLFLSLAAIPRHPVCVYTLGNAYRYPYRLHVPPKRCNIWTGFTATLRAVVGRAEWNDAIN